MAFGDVDANLSGTVFSATDLHRARHFFRLHLASVVPNWIANPTGFMGQLWKAAGFNQNAACTLIEVARVFSVLQDRVTEKSVISLRDKLKNLSRVGSVNQFDEQLTELQFAEALSTRVRPISFEPFVPADPLCAAMRPQSPDFGVIVPDGFLLFEFTVFRIEALQRCERFWQGYAELLMRIAENREWCGRFVIECPMMQTYPALDLTKVAASLPNEFDADGERKWPIAIGAAATSIHWIPLEFTGVTDAATGKVIPELSLSFAVAHLQPSSTNTLTDEVFLKSLRKTLEKKRKQFRGFDGPCILVLKLGHQWLNWEHIEHVIQSRLWPNSAYSHLAAILRFTPRTSYEQGAAGFDIRAVPNPNCRYEVPTSLIRLFGSEQVVFENCDPAEVIGRYNVGWVGPD
jgi:hypothetical protein